MRKSQLWKRVLTGSLVLALTVADVAPVQAAGIQPQDSVISAEDAGLQDLQDETSEAGSAGQKADVQAAEMETALPGTDVTEPEAEDKAEAGQQDTAQENDLTKETATYAEGGAAAQAATVTPTITNFRVTPVTSTNSSNIRFKLTYTLADCDSLRLRVTDPTGNEIYSRYYDKDGSSYFWDDNDNEYNYNYNTEYWVDSSSFDYSINAGVTYTFTLTPYKTVYNEEDGYDEEVAGTPATGTWTAPRPATVTGLAVKEMTPDGIYFSHSAVPAGTSVYLEYSTNRAFNENLADVDSTSSDRLYYDSLTSGMTYYVRAYSYAYGTKGAYSNVVSVKAPVAEVTNISTEILDKGVTLKMSASYGDYTGFEVSRKIGKKYQVLATTTAHTYNDTGLTKDTKYTYRVRAYYYNTDTKKKAYGAYEYKTVQTGAAAMNLKAQATGKSSIKLTWKKVSGAAGYDVYRNVGSSSSSTRKSGEYYGFDKYELVKSLSKKKSSFTDKKLVAGESYGYRVKAYKLVKKQKVYFTEDSASASTKFSFNTSVNIYKQAQSSKNGKVAIAWYPIPQAKGYLIERYDDTKGEWVTQRKISSAKTTKYTLPASPLGQSIHYRVRAYNGKKYSGSGNVYVEGHIAPVTGVKAKASSTGVQISWKSVAGASYYRVYRTADLGATYDADTKTYDYSGGSEVEIQVFKQTSITNNYYYTLGSSNVKMEMDDETAQKLAYHRPNSTSSWVDTGKIAGTTVTDYAYSYHRPVYNEQGIATKENITTYGPKNDVSYQYYVIAYREVMDKDGSWITGESFGASKSATAAISTISVKAPSIKAKAGKKSATISYKKVKGANKYLIYRSTKKKGSYELVGVSAKTSYKDAGLTTRKTYYYKVKAVASNSLGADKYSSFSKVKSVKAK